MHAAFPLPDFEFEPNSPLEKLAALLWGAHRHMREGLRYALEHQSAHTLAAAAATAEADTIFRIDQIAEHLLFEYLAAQHHETPAFWLVGEFETGERLKYGEGEPAFRVLFDPIDGTRLVMYGKSSGWILSGIFTEKGEATRLSETLFALQTEIPLPKYLYAETLWAAPDKGAHRLIENLVTHETSRGQWHADTASDLRHSFVSFVNIFQHGKTAIAALEEDFLRLALAEQETEPALVFGDQHLSTAGQLYALVRGQLKLVVDVRPQLNRILQRTGKATMLCSHPYDLCTWLIAHEAGAIILSPDGEPLEGATHATADLAWVGFTNRTLAERFHEILLRVLRQHELI